jgi:ABC-type amino acid transport substrate-binding protein
MKNIKSTLALCALLVGTFLGCSLAQAESTEAVLQKGKLAFALTGKYPPFSFIDTEGNLKGFDVDIGNALAQRIGVQPAPVTTAWDGIIGGLLAHKYDTIIGSLAITEERKKAVDFSDAYYQSGAQLFVSKGSPLKNIDELNGKVVGVTLGETYETWLREHKPGITLKTYKGLPDILLDLQNKRLDGFVTDKIAGVLAIRDKNLNAQPVGELLYPEKMGIAIRKDNPELKAAINSALAQMIADGTYTAISLKWLGTDIH